MASSISNYSISSSRFAHEFPPHINVKTEMDYGFQWGGQHVCPQSDDQLYPGSPHGFSSCMYATSVASPCLPPPPSTPDSNNCVTIISSAKENGGFRSVPSCRRRLDFNHNACMDIAKMGPVAVAKRNERERNRVKLINMTFHTLRQHLPLSNSGTKGKSRKLSKVQTLRSAIDYIRQLQALVHNRQQHHQQLDPLQKHGDQDSSSKTPISCERHDQNIENNNIIRSSLKRDKSRGYFVCQTPYRGMNRLCAIDELSKDVVASPGTRGDALSSCSTSNSNAESPYSDASSFDTVTTPEDEEYLDFEDWF